MVNYKTVGQFSAESGFSEGAIRKMIERQIWKERDVWVRANGRILIAVEGYHNWVEAEAGLGKSLTPAYKSNLSIRVSPAESASSASPSPWSP